MKFANKETGKIAKLIEFSETGLTLRYEETGRLVFVDLLTKLKDEWEDYRERYKAGGFRWAYDFGGEE